jgi:hypothetical protein
VVTATGISINGSGMTTLADTLIGVFGGSGSTATGILVTGADTRLTRVEASASASGTGSATGLSAVASSFLRIEGGRLSPSSAVTSIGYSSSASSADVSGLHVSASGSAQAVGVLTTGPGTLAFADLTVSTLGGPGVHDYGVEVGGNANVSIRNSFLAGTPKSVIHDPGGLGTMRIAYSRLSTPGSGTMFCLGAFDDTFAARNASCV